MDANEACDPSLDDVTLIAAIAEGDQSAFAVLYDRYAPLVLALCLRVLRDRTLAEEVLDDVFWELWRRPNRYGPSRSSPKTYLLLLTRSRAIDRLRSERTARARTMNMIDPDGAGAESSGTRQQDPAAEAVESDELRQHVQGAMHGLDANKRRAIELSFFEGLSHKDIAQRLDQPLGTVKTRIRAGLSQLRQALRAYYSREDES